MKKYSDALAALPGILDDYVSSQTTEAEKLFPMPTEPEKPQSVIDEEREHDPEVIALRQKQKNALLILSSPTDQQAPPLPI